MIKKICLMFKLKNTTPAPTGLLLLLPNVDGAPRASPVPSPGDSRSEGDSPPVPGPPARRRLHHLQVSGKSGKMIV
jgi:hypothetical protein